jgi:hypothetical protein
MMRSSAALVVLLPEPVGLHRQQLARQAHARLGGSLQMDVRSACGYCFVEDAVEIERHAVSYLNRSGTAPPLGTSAQ